MEKVTSFLDALASYKWTDEAACADDPDPDKWFTEPSAPDRTGLSNPRILEAHLICAGCSVRRDCLRESLRVWRSPILDNGQPIEYRTVGVWGASTEEDRAAASGHLPVCPASTLKPGIKRALTLELGRRVMRHWRCTKGDGNGCKPVSQVTDQLEDELPERMRTRIEAFEAHYPRDGRRNQNAERVWTMLDGLRGIATSEPGDRTTSSV